MGTTATVQDSNQQPQEQATGEEQQVQAQPEALPVSSHVTPKQLDYGVFWVRKTKKRKDGTEYQVEALKAITDEKEINESKQNGTFAFSQTIGWNEALDIEGCHEVIPDAKEFVKNFNDGTKTSRVTPRMKRMFEELVDAVNEQGVKTKVPVFQPITGVLPIFRILQETATRKTKTKEERIRETLRKLPGLTDASNEELDKFFAFAKQSGMLPALTAEVEAESEDDESEDEEESAEATA
jgi:hypothetical protein